MSTNANTPSAVSPEWRGIGPLFWLMVLGLGVAVIGLLIAVKADPTVDVLTGKTNDHQMQWYIGWLIAGIGEMLAMFCLIAGAVAVGVRYAKH